MQRFFAPGRTELAGNHTDHQLGRVLAASVDVGIRARAARRRDRRVCIHSRGYRPFTVSLDDLSVDPRAYGKPWALVRGVAASILEAGGQIGGFEAWASSALRTGGGLSSSAAFEILVGRIFNALYNGGAFTPEQLARFGQQAENRHFGKPSGLMDQMACARSGAVYLDFAAGEILPVAASFAAMGLTLSLTDTGGSHAGLTAAYAAIPADMHSVAQRFGAETLSQVDPADFFAHRQPGIADDRAAHFFAENARVPQMRDALARRDAGEYLRLMNASGRSSEQLLRNIQVPGGDDRLARGLACASALLDGVGQKSGGLLRGRVFKTREGDFLPAAGRDRRFQNAPDRGPLCTCGLRHGGGRTGARESGPFARKYRRREGKPCGGTPRMGFRRYGGRCRQGVER